MYIYGRPSEGPGGRPPRAPQRGPSTWGGAGPYRSAIDRASNRQSIGNRQAIARAQEGTIARAI